MSAVKLLLLLLTLFISMLFESAAHPSHESFIIYGYKNYTEYRVGDSDSNIIISAPHGGAEQPQDIPTTTNGCFDSESGHCIWNVTACVGRSNDSRCSPVHANDDNTPNLAIYFADSIHELTGKHPHLILTNLDRSRVDMNRPRILGAQYQPEAEKAWDDFHGFIAQAKSAIRGRGLLIDLHGQSHPEEWIELGYLLRPFELNENTIPAQNTSIRYLASQSDDAFEEILRGNRSLGYLLQESYGYKAIPSPDNPGPKDGNYYNGGYITRAYGSRDGGEIDAIQIESPKSLRSNTSAMAYGQNLAKAVYQYMEWHYSKSKSSASNRYLIPHLWIIAAITASHAAIW